MVIAGTICSKNLGWGLKNFKLASKKRMGSYDRENRNQSWDFCPTIACKVSSVQIDAFRRYEEYNIFVLTPIAPQGDYTPHFQCFNACPLKAPTTYEKIIEF